MTDDAVLRRALAVTEVRRGATRLARRLRAERPEGALSPSKIAVLAGLYRHGPSTAGDVAAAERQRPQSLTRVFAELEQDGLISRRRSDQDRRETLISLTSAGRESLVHDMAVREEWLDQAMGGLTETEVEVLRIAGTLMDRLADAPAPARTGKAPERPRVDRVG